MLNFEKKNYIEIFRFAMEIMIVGMEKMRE